jgi:transposase-like protein
MTERELARGAARRLAIIRHAQEVTGNVSGTSRYYGITRQIYYTWLRRYEEGGLDGIRTRDPHLGKDPPSVQGRPPAFIFASGYGSERGRGQPRAEANPRGRSNIGRRNRARTEKGVVSERASVHHGEPPRGDLEHPPVNPPREGLEPRGPRRRTIRP